MSGQITYFVHISDTHIGPTPDYEQRGHNALACAERLVREINNLPQRPDFVIHTGDVVSEPHPLAYRQAARVFAALEVPIYYVAGNHDRAVDIEHFLPMGAREDLASGGELLTYNFEVRGYRFLVVDACGPSEIEPQGLFSARQLEIVRREVEDGDQPLLIFTHFPILPLNSIWMDANMLTMNGMAFHDIICDVGARLRGVFYGHVHQHMQTVRDGVLYVSVARAFSQFSAWPDDVVNRYDTEHPPGYGFIHLLPEQTIIHQHVFTRPQSP